MKKWILFVLPLLVLACAQEPGDEVVKNIYGKYKGQTEGKRECEVSFYNSDATVDFKMEVKNEDPTKSPLEYTASFKAEEFEKYIKDVVLKPGQKITKAASGSTAGIILELEIKFNELKNVRHWVVFKKEQYVPCLQLSKQ